MSRFQFLSRVVGVILLQQYFMVANCNDKKFVVFRKVTTNEIDNKFYSTKDYFTNPTTDSRDFCMSRNAKCMSLFDCSQCHCMDEKDIFLSYQHGCVPFTKSKRILKASACMTISPMRNDQMLGSPTVFFLANKNKRHRLYLPYSISNAKACNISAMTLFEMHYGIESNFNVIDIDKQALPTFQLEKSSMFYYFKCAKNKCNLKNLFGKIIRLSITCSTYNQRTKDTCFVFEMRGKYYSDEDATITSTKPPTQPVQQPKGVLMIERLEMQESKNVYIPKDVFANPDGVHPFCSEFKASCYQNVNCFKCVCNDDRDAFISYRYGCMNIKTAKTKLGLGSCLHVRGHMDDIFYIHPNDFNYGTCIHLKLPSSLHQSDGLSCVVESTNYIDALTGQETNSSGLSLFRTKFTNIYNDELCLQCTSFMCDLSRYSGRLLKLRISCKNYKTLQPPIDTCFVFRMGGLQLIGDDASGDVIEKISQKHGSTEVERKVISDQKEDMVGNHFKSRDCFTNPKRNENFCWKQKAVCDPTAAQCSKCQCLTDYSTFVSFKHGCMNITKDSKEYGIRNCMHYLGEVVLVKPAYFQHKRCVYMQKPTNFRFNVGFSSCVVNQMFHIEPINGNEAEILSTTVGGPFRISTSRLKDNQNNFCLQCDSYNCDLASYTGMLLKLHIQCNDLADKTKKKETCFVFKLGGFFAMNETIPLILPNAGASKKGSSSGTTAAVVICLLFVFAALAVLLYFWWRRKLRRNKSDCAHQVFDKTRTASTKPEVKPVHLAYASVGACPSIKHSSPMKSVAAQKEENLYYKAAENDPDNDPIYSTTDVTLNNPLYGGAITPVTEKVPFSPSNDDTATASVMENIYTTATDRVDNPIYGSEDPKSPDYTTVDNIFSQDNKYYVSGSSVAPIKNLPHEPVDDVYTAVTTTNTDNLQEVKNKPPEENVYLQPCDGFQAQQQQQQEQQQQQQQQQQDEPTYDGSNKYYQVGDVISSGMP